LLINNDVRFVLTISIDWIFIWQTIVMVKINEAAQAKSFQSKKQVYRNRPIIRSISFDSKLNLEFFDI
jgi:hypothetical protein